jgi:hypothetical protein
MDRIRVKHMGDNMRGKLIFKIILIILLGIFYGSFLAFYCFAQGTTVQSFKSPLSIIYGGTGKASTTANSYLKGNGTGALVERTYSEVRTDLGLAPTDRPSFNALNINDATYNVFIGKNSGISNVSGQFNVSIGEGALEDMTEGGYNVAIGYYALNKVVSGEDNIAIGRSSLENTTGNSNVGIGYYSLINNSVGTFNLAIGSNSLQNSTVGSDNVAIGSEAQWSNTTGVSNSSFGNKSGYSNLIGNGNIFIGYNSGFFETGSDKLFIDNRQRANEADGRIKALIYGVMNADPANQSVRINGSVVSPYYFSVQYPGGKWATLLAGGGGAGFGFSDTGYFGIGRISSFYATPTNDIYVNSFGNTCLGDADPTQKLDVRGNIKAYGFMGDMIGGNFTGQSPLSKYPLQTGDHVKATSVYAGFDPWYATNPLSSLIGQGAGESWVAPTDTNQRFHIDLGVQKVINRIYYENYHAAGTVTDVGARHFSIQGSNSATAFAELTYATDTNWTTITSGLEMAQHAAANTADPKYINFTNTVPYRYYALKIADNWGYSGFIGFRRIELQTVNDIGEARVTVAEHADNAAALAVGLTAGAFYRTGDNLKVVH